MKITIVGTGYVGLITGVCLASKGHKVIAVDINKKIVESINKSKPHFHEKGLPELLKKVISNKSFYASTSLEKALNLSEVVIIAVGTPSKNGDIDLSYVEFVSEQIGKYMKSSKNTICVIVKSTVVPGTTDNIIKNIIEKKSNLDHKTFGLGMNPEFLKEGSAIYDFMNPDRIVFGYEDDKALKILKNLYKPFDCQKILVNTRTAEFIKYANNTILASQISLSNELSLLASKLSNVDFTKVLHGVQSDYRWNPKFENKSIKPDILSYQIPGCGYGGSCFPKDVEAISALGSKQGIDMVMTNAITKVNSKQPYQVVNLIEQKFGSIKSKKVLLLGLSFKPETDDVRESPSIKIIESIYDLDTQITVHDPIALRNFKKKVGHIFPKIISTSNWKNCIGKNEIIIVATNWIEYRELLELDISRKLVFDCKRLFSPDEIKCSQYLTFGYNFDSKPI